MGRVAAIAAAVAMIVGALIVRDQVIEGDDGNGGGNGGAAGALVCARELPDGICEGGEEAPFGSTLDTLTSGDESDATWIAPGPWPEAVDLARSASASPAFDRVEPLASTDLVAVVFRTPAACGNGPVTWRCLGDAAGQAGRVAAPSSDTAVRVLIRGALLAAYIGDESFDIGALDLPIDDRPPPIDWISAAERSIDQARNRQAASLGEVVANRGASADVFITTMAEARAARVSAATIVVPGPAVRVVATAGVVGRTDVSDARDALRAAGWTVPPQTGEDDGLPSPGVLLALREITS